MPCLPIPWTAWILLIVSHSSLVEGALILLTVLINNLLLPSNSGLNKCMLLAWVVLNIDLSPFFFSILYSAYFWYLDLLSHLCNLVSAWSCISVAYDFLEASLASYHSQVLELAKELLVAYCYFESNSNYWVESSLVSDSDAETCVFKAAKVVCNLQEGLSS